MARLPDDEIQRRYEAALAKVDITQEEAAIRWPGCDPEDRERRRRLAIIWQAKHATVVDDETGQKLVGGHQPRKNKQDVIQSISGAADERQKEIIDALFAPLSDPSPAVRGKGAERIVKIKSELVERERRDREELRMLGREDLIARLAEGIMSSKMGGDLMKKLAGHSKALPVGTRSDIEVDGRDAEAA